MKWHSLWIAFLAAFSIGISGCTPPDDSPDPPELDIQMPDDFGGGDEGEGGSGTGDDGSNG